MDNNAKAIFLDLDNTLYVNTACNEHAIQEVVAFVVQELKRSEADVKDGFLAGRKQINKILYGTGSSHSRLLYLQTCIESLIGKTNISLTLLAEDVFWNAFLSQMKLRDGVVSFLETVKKKNCKVVIVTDLTTQIQLKKIQHLQILQYIDFVVTSEESGRDKPDPASFQLAMKKSGIPASETLMIGDDYDKDIVPARAFGMETVYLNLDGRKEIESKEAKDFFEVQRLLF